MRLAPLLAASALAVAATAASASELDLNLSNDTVRVKYNQDLTSTGLEGNLHFLHNQDHGNVGGVGLHLVDDAVPGRGALDVGLGANAYLVDSKHGRADGGGLGVGGKFRYTWPTFNRLGIAGFGYYAPPVVAYDKVKDLYEYGLRVEYLILRHAGAYVGFRQMKINVDHGDRFTFDSGFHVGMRLEF